jgi:hypothetical protein
MVSDRCSCQGRLNGTHTAFERHPKTSTGEGRDRHDLKLQFSKVNKVGISATVMLQEGESLERREVVMGRMGWRQYLTDRKMAC